MVGCAVNGTDFGVREKDHMGCDPEEWRGKKRGGGCPGSADRERVRAAGKPRR